MSALSLVLLCSGFIFSGYLMGRKIKNKWWFAISQIASVIVAYNLVIIMAVISNAGLRNIEKAGFLFTVIGLPLIISGIVMVKFFLHMKHAKADLEKSII